MNNFYIHKIDAGGQSGEDGALYFTLGHFLKRMPKVLRFILNAEFFWRNAKKIGRNALLIGPDAICIWPNAYEFRRNALLSLIFLFCVCTVQARQQEGGALAANGQADTIRPLKIGGIIPEALWSEPLQIANGHNRDTLITLGNFRNKRLIILEFWASWCKPCIRSLQRLDSLLQSNGNQEWLVIPVQVYDAADKVAPFMHKRRWNWFSVVNTMLLNQAFSNYINAFGSVWIKDGRLYAVPNLLKTDLSENQILLKQALQ